MSRYSSDTLSGRTNQQISKFYNSDHSNFTRKKYKSFKSVNALPTKQKIIRYSSYHDFSRNNHVQKIHPVRQSIRMPPSLSEVGQRTRSSRTSNSICDLNPNTIVDYNPYNNFVQEYSQKAPNIEQPPLPNLIKEFSRSDSSILSLSISGCGGHCLFFQNFCHYFLQVIFGMGILTGMSLCLIGSVLPNSRSRDLQVLVYIGALISIVSAFLLTIQCRVRNQIRKRKRAINNTTNVSNERVIPLLQIVNSEQSSVHNQYNFV